MSTRSRHRPWFASPGDFARRVAEFEAREDVDRATVTVGPPGQVTVQRLCARGRPGEALGRCECGWMRPEGVRCARPFQWVESTGTGERLKSYGPPAPDPDDFDIEVAGVRIDPRNAAEEAEYTFTLKDGVRHPPLVVYVEGEPEPVDPLADPAVRFRRLPLGETLDQIAARIDPADTAAILGTSAGPVTMGPSFDEYLFAVSTDGRRELLEHEARVRAGGWGNIELVALPLCTFPPCKGTTAKGQPCQLWDGHAPPCDRLVSSDVAVTIGRAEPGVTCAVTCPVCASMGGLCAQHDPSMGA